jgi:FkbM family methyltransferase
MSIRSIGRRILVSVSPSALKQTVIRMHRFWPGFIGDRELRALPVLVQPDRAVLDVGMHYGLYAIFLEDVAGPANLYGFEPLPSKLPELRRMFPRSQILPIALSDRAGTGVLSIPIVGSTAKTSRATLEAIRGTEAEAVTVVVDRLDDLHARGVIPDVGFAKIDVEGHENNLLRGAVDVLRRCRPNLIIEIEQRHHEAPIQATFDALERLGYALYFLPPERDAIAPISAFRPLVHQNIEHHGSSSYVANFIALPLPDATATLNELARVGLPLVAD